MNALTAALLLTVAGTLEACNGSPVTQDSPQTNLPPAPDTTAVADTTAAARTGGAVPFVSPTQAGRLLGPRSPSPPASRTH
jgi:hypothetical protein